jgi:hypothetical protein
MVMVKKINQNFSIRIYLLFLGGGHTLIANALITDEHSTVTGK